MENITLAIIKPDAVAAGNAGKIIDRILQTGFKIRASRIIHLTRGQAENLYAVHRARPFYDELTTFMSSAPAMPLVLEKSGSVEQFRKLIGATDPLEAEKGRSARKSLKIRAKMRCTAPIRTKMLRKRLHSFSHGRIF